MRGGTPVLRAHAADGGDGRELRPESGRDAQGLGEPTDRAGGADDPGFVPQLGHGAPLGPGQPVPVGNAQPQRVAAQLPLAQPVWAETGSSCLDTRMSVPLCSSFVPLHYNKRQASETS